MTAEVAELVLKAHRTRGYAPLSDSDVSFLGGGSFRKAYLCGGRVYKVESHDYDYNGKRGNRMEYENYQTLQDRGLPEHAAVPAMELHVIDGEPVLEADYIVGESVGFQHYGYEQCICVSWCRRQVLLEVTNRFGFGDLSGDNIVDTPNALYLIDLGEEIRMRYEHRTRSAST